MTRALVLVVAIAAALAVGPAGYAYVSNRWAP